MRIFIFLYLAFIGPLCAVTNWNSAINLSLPGEGAVHPQISVNSSNQAIAVWSRSNGTNTIIQAAKYDGTSWGSPVDLSQSGEDADYPYVAIDASGHAVAVWVRSNGTNTIIQGSSYDGTGWSSPIDISTSGHNADQPQLAVNQSGTGFAIWRRSNGANTIIQAAKYEGTSWSSPVDLSDPGADAENPDIAINEVGQAVAVWARFVDPIVSIQAKLYDGVIWDLATTTFTATDLVDSSAPQVAIDSAGHAVSIWLGNRGSYQIVWTASYDGSSWNTPTYISPPSLSAFGPTLTLNSSGQGIGAWGVFLEVDFSMTYTIIQACLYDGSWASTSLVYLSQLDQNAGHPEVAINDSRTGIAVWARFNGTNTIIQTSSLDKGNWSSSGKAVGNFWSFPVDISASGHDAADPEVAINALGNAMSVWEFYNGSNEVIQAASYSPFYSSSAQPFRASQSMNTNAFQTDFYATLNWSAPESFTLVGYLIYRNGVEIATLPPETLTFVNHYLAPSTTYVFSLFAEDPEGNLLQIGTATIETPK